MSAARGRCRRPADPSRVVYSRCWERANGIHRPVPVPSASPICQCGVQGWYNWIGRPCHSVLHQRAPSPEVLRAVRLLVSTNYLTCRGAMDGPNCWRNSGLVTAQFNKKKKSVGIPQLRSPLHSSRLERCNHRADNPGEPHDKQKAVAANCPDCGCKWQADQENRGKKTGRGEEAAIKAIGGVPISSAGGNGRPFTDCRECDWVGCKGCCD